MTTVSVGKNVITAFHAFLSQWLLESLGEKFGSVSSSDWVRRILSTWLDSCFQSLAHLFSWVSRLHHVCSSYWIPRVGREACLSGWVNKQMASPVAWSGNSGPLERRAWTYIDWSVHEVSFVSFLHRRRFAAVHLFCKYIAKHHWAQQ